MIKINRINFVGDLSNVRKGVADDSAALNAATESAYLVRLEKTPPPRSIEMRVHRRRRGDLVFSFHSASGEVTHTIEAHNIRPIMTAYGKASKTYDQKIKQVAAGDHRAQQTLHGQKAAALTQAAQELQALLRPICHFEDRTANAVVQALFNRIG